MSTLSKSTPSPLRLIIGTLIGGIVIGGVIAIAGQIVYVIVIFPMLMGGAGGLIAAGDVSHFGVRRRWIAAGVGAGLGMMIYGSYRYIDYLLFLHHLSSSTPLFFIDYLRLVAALGTSVGTSALHVSLGETLTWGYWILEAILVIGLSAYLSMLGVPKVAAKPTHNLGGLE